MSNELFHKNFTIQYTVLLFSISRADNNDKSEILMMIEEYVWLESTLKNEKSRMEVVMKRVNIKRNDYGVGIVVAALFTFSFVNNLALCPLFSQDNANIAFSTAQSDDINDGFAASHDGSHGENIVNETKVSNSDNAQTRLKIQKVANAEDTSDTPDKMEDDSRNPLDLIGEIPDWQLIHSAELPYGDYFIDTRIIGAVRYHADFSLENEYGIPRELANIQKDLSQYLAISHPRETMEVFFFQSRDTYRRFLGRELHDAPFDRDALYYKPSGPGMVLIYQKPSMMEDLRHEMTHAFLHASLPYIPLWLDEGLAEYFEKPRETRARTNPYFSSVSRKIMFGQVPSLNKLEKMRYFDQMGVNEYCEAWSWVHFMIHHSRETHQMLAGYLRLLSEYGEKTPPLDLYLAKTVPETKKAYLDHFRNWKSRNDSNARTNTATRQSPAESDDPAKETAPAEKSPESQLSLGWSKSVIR